MRLLHLIPVTLLLAPALALAEAPCQHSEARALKLDLAGVRTVRFDVHSHNLHVQASAGAGNSIDGRACASSADLLPHLQVLQRRDGDRLVVSLEADSVLRQAFNSGYAYLDMHAQVPDNVLVQLDVGSGDAWASGAASLSADIGSGDVEASATKGKVTAKVGSGDLTINGAGAFDLLGVGSGDVRASDIRGAASIGTIGSGDLDVRDVDGALTLQRKGSGDVRHRDVRGAVSLPRD